MSRTTVAGPSEAPKSRALPYLVMPTAMEVRETNSLRACGQAHSPGQPGGELVLTGVDVLQEALEVGDRPAAYSFAGKLGCRVQSCPSASISRITMSGVVSSAS